MNSLNTPHFSVENDGENLARQGLKCLEQAPRFVHGARAYTARGQCFN